MLKSIYTIGELNMKKPFFVFDSYSGIVFKTYNDGTAKFAIRRKAFDGPNAEYSDEKERKKIIFEHVAKFKGMSEAAYSDFVSSFYNFASKYPFSHAPGTKEDNENEDDDFNNDDFDFHKSGFPSEQACAKYLKECFYYIAEDIGCCEKEPLKAVYYIPKYLYSKDACFIIEDCIERLNKYAILLAENASDSNQDENALNKKIKDIFLDNERVKNNLSNYFNTIDCVMETVVGGRNKKITPESEELKTEDKKEVFKQLGLKPATEKQIDINETVEKAFEGLIGLDEIKVQLKEILAYIIQNSGKDKSLCLHMAFVGNPGTGKTTVAQIVANVLAEADVISSNKLISIKATSMQAEYLGQTPAKVEKIIKDGIGKVTLIDEAYALAQGNYGPNEYKEDAVSTLITGLEEHRNDSCFIFAGYPDKMEDFFNMNPGLESRIGNRVQFRDFNDKELCQIFDMFNAEAGREIDDDAKEYINFKLAELGKDPKFANARGVRNVFDRISRKQAIRVNGSKDDRRIKLEDAVLGVEAYKKSKEKAVQRTIGFGQIYPEITNNEKK